MVYEKGSEWRKWDLHVHTKGTLKNDQFKSVDFNAYCVEMFKKALEKDIVVIGITDYFSIENYKQVKEFVSNIEECSEFTSEEKNKIEKIFILPNVELRMVPVTNANKLINIHCLFNPEEGFLGYLDNHFFASLKDAGGYKMNQSGFTELGKRDANLPDEVAYKVGVGKFVLDISTLTEVFESDLKLKENTIIVVSNSSHDGASGIQEHYTLFEGDSGSADEIRSNIYKLSDVIFSGNYKDREFFLGLKKDSCTKEEVIQKCRSLKPCIHGSDAHTEDDLFNPKKGRYCWIKADPTFEGLKQIICEPEDRVSIQENKPEEKSSYQVIDAIEITGEICSQTIYFNPNLNTVIGGRSTGKSTLLELIAYQFNLKDDVRREIRNLEVSITWKDKEQNKNRDIEFFAQNHMHDIATNSGKKDSLIEEVIKNKPDYIFIKDYNQFCHALKSIIQNQIDNLFELNKEKKELGKSLSEKGDKKGIENEIQNIKDKIQEMNSDSFSEEDMKLYRETKQFIQKNEQRLLHLQADIKEIERLKNSEEFFGESNLHRFNDLSEESRENVCAIFDKIQKRFAIEWKEALNGKINTLKETVEQCNKTIKVEGESEVLRDGNEYFKNNKQQKELNARLEVEYKKLIEVNTIDKKIEDLQKQESALFDKIIEDHVAYCKNMQDLKSKFRIKHDDDDDDDILIRVGSKFEDRKCEGLLTDFINLRSHDRQEYVREFIHNYEKDVEGEVKTFLKKALSDEIELKSYKDIRDLTKGLLTENWLSICYELTYQGDNFEEMSDGKKAFVVLKLLLDFSDKECPILIDQPEDSLDNRAIYRELVTYIKNKKKGRQIILVTHNANVVVNADAEEVIVANKHAKNNKNKNGIKFQYISGSLEDTFLKKGEPILESQGIREHVCEILEGGKEAFERRDKKYGFKSQ